jgi:NAD(P)-dependent dehydrogenase (short-subunit alcohol dehydrogenase family)
MNLDLSLKQALVTSSTVGIGYIAPLGLARLGAAVIVNGRTQARVDTAADKIRATVDGAQVIGVAAGLGMVEGIQHLT